MLDRLLQGPAGLGSEAVAVLDGDRRLPYRTLRDRTYRLANGLLGVGLQPGDRVLDLQKNSHTYIESDLAMLAAGLVRIPLNHRMTLADQLHIAADSGARGCIFGPEFMDEAD